MKIDVSEVLLQKELLSISVESIKSQLSVSRSRLSEVVATDSLKGLVKDAINNKVTNYQIPLVDNYINTLDSIFSRYEGILKLFQETVSETDNSAIIHTEYLESLKQRIKDPVNDLNKISSEALIIYAGIGDILHLTNPSLDSVKESYSQAVKSLDDTIKNMEAFNSVLLKTDTFDLIDMQNSEIATLSGYASLPYGNTASRNYYNRTWFKNSVSEIHTAIHSNSKAVKYQNALAKQLAESKYSGTIAENKDLIDALFNVYKNVTTSDLYKNSKGYKKYLKSILPALYTAYRFKKDRFGNVIVYKDTTLFWNKLDEFLKLNKKLNQNKSYAIALYSSGKPTKAFESLFAKLGNTRYNEGLRNVLATFDENTKMVHKIVKVGESLVKTTNSLLKEEFIKEVTFKGALKNVWKSSKAGGGKGLVESATDSFKNYKEGFKSASKFGKFLKGAAVVGVALDVVDTFSKVHDNKQEAKRQGLRGNEVNASVTTGFVIDAAKAAGTTVAATAAASAGAAGVGAVVTGVAAAFGAAVTAPAWLTGAAAIGTAALVGWGLSELDKRFKITDNLKKGANSLIKGMRGWFK